MIAFCFDGGHTAGASRCDCLTINLILDIASSNREFRSLLSTLMSAPASADLDCASLNGKWSGSMKGLLNGATTMTLKKCRMNWQLPDKRTNICRLREKKDEIQYKCSLGSRGVVKISGNRMTMKNVYTAAKHGAYTVSLKKAN